MKQPTWDQEQFVLDADIAVHQCSACLQFGHRVSECPHVREPAFIMVEAPRLLRRRSRIRLQDFGPWVCALWAMVGFALGCVVAEMWRGM